MNGFPRIGKHINANSVPLDEDVTVTLFVAVVTVYAAPAKI